MVKSTMKTIFSLNTLAHVRIVENIIIQSNCDFGRTNGGKCTHIVTFLIEISYQSIKLKGVSIIYYKAF